MKTKKSKVINLLKFGILFLSISLLLWNCEKQDNPIQEIEQYQPKLKISKIHKKQIQENKIISQKLQSFKGKIKTEKKDGTFSKSIYSSEYDFYIETDYATYIENQDGSYHSYTFPIQRTINNGLIENLLLSLQTDETYKMFLTSYQLSEQDLVDIENGIEVDFTNKINSNEISDDNLINDVFAKTYGCVETYYVSCSVGGSANGHGPAKQNNGSYCSGSDFVIDVSGCGGSGISYGNHNISTGTGSNYTGSGNTTNGTGTSHSDSATATAATYNLTTITNCFNCPTLEEQKFIDFIENLSTENQNFLNQIVNKSLKGKIELFLNNNLDSNENYTIEAINFAKKYLELSILNIDNLTNEEIESFFNFNQDYKNRMSVSERAIFNNMSKIKQIGYLFNAQKATWRAEELFPNSIYNGKGDAFRHAYFNGLNAILLGLPLAESLATAHEDKPSAYFHDSKEKDMDLFNNQVGRDRSNWFQDGFSSLEESILEAMDYGLLRYLSNLQGGGLSGRATNLSVLTLSNN